ncbi:hypothetical protein HN020_02750 [Brevibacillus borstelensis]|uniref:hypothetical protein n=1 Tax=Brevibacillus borstelensis TaxID=45462 RepID=UPI00148FF85D|nr:hypothetical protein [Brevibacillus borstelensis]NOU53722.1 hypothetical protein [Brevibacillus borstelensis]
MDFVPRKYEQDIPVEVFKASPLSSGKVEFTGTDLFWSDEELKHTVLMLISNLGLRRLVEILPGISKNDLIQVLEEQTGWSDRLRKKKGVKLKKYEMKVPNMELPILEENRRLLGKLKNEF